MSFIRTNETQYLNKLKNICFSETRITHTREDKNTRIPLSFLKRETSKMVGVTL